MANLQIKSIDDDLYAQLKALAASENRSVSQQVLFLLKGYLAKKQQLQNTKTPAQVLLELSGSWDDAKTPEQIVRMLENARKNSQKLPEGF
jgi:plasmid stability protein